jgi:hypothetical protein
MTDKWWHWGEREREREKTLKLSRDAVATNTRIFDAGRTKRNRYKVAHNEYSVAGEILGFGTEFQNFFNCDCDKKRQTRKMIVLYPSLFPSLQL